MPNIQTGIARQPSPSRRIWTIVDDDEFPICQFDHETFSNILNRARVKFIDDDIRPGMAEQVWSVSDVDPLVESALPAKGATDLAYAHLEFYVMNKLMVDLLNQRSGSATAVSLLIARMAQIKAALNAMPEQRATIHTLRTIGI